MPRKNRERERERDRRRSAATRRTTDPFNKLECKLDYTYKYTVQECSRRFLVVDEGGKRHEVRRCGVGGMSSRFFTYKTIPTPNQPHITEVYVRLARLFPYMSYSNSESKNTSTTEEKAIVLYRFVLLYCCIAPEGALPLTTVLFALYGTVLLYWYHTGGVVLLLYFFVLF